MAPSPPKTGDLIGKKLGNYELMSLIAIGGTAEIYLARIAGEMGFEKYVVVKSLLDHLADSEDYVSMFLDEARIGAQLEHSNIVQTLELGQHEGRYFLVMEHLVGMSLAQMARKVQERQINGGLIGTDIVLSLASQACTGLHYAHERSIRGQSLNIVHRDISPQNLVVSYEGVLKIVDFGIAKSDLGEVQTRTGTIKGKYAYMSPEQCRADPVDRRTDIFALGTVCHELLTGRRLFKRPTSYDTYQAILSGKVPLPSSINHQLDGEIDDLVMKALAPNREDRYGTAQEFGEAMLRLLHARSGFRSNEVPRFLEEHFAQEAADHAQHMRALFVGQEANLHEEWNTEVKDVVPLEKKDSLGAELDPVTTQLPDGCPDEGPTRVEFDPAARVANMHEDHLDDSWERDTGDTKASKSAPRSPSDDIEDPTKKSAKVTSSDEEREPSYSDTEDEAVTRDTEDDSDLSATVDRNAMPASQDTDVPSEPQKEDLPAYPVLSGPLPVNAATMAQARRALSYPPDYPTSATTSDPVMPTAVRPKGEIPRLWPHFVAFGLFGVVGFALAALVRMLL